MYFNRIIRTFIIALVCISFSSKIYSAVNEVESDLVVQLDDPHIQIGSNFFGEELLIFGAFNNSDLSKSDIIIKVRGASKTISVRRKAKKYGIWMNSQNTVVDNVPSYYAIYSNRNIQRITDKDFLKENQIGLEYLEFKSNKKNNTSDIYREIIKKNKEGGIFTEKYTGVRIIGNKLFRASVQLPKDINEGSYEVSIYFFDDQKLVDRDISKVFVNKTLAGKYIYTQAKERPLLYGIICVVIAWIAGLLVAGLSRVR